MEEQPRSIGPLLPRSRILSVPRHDNLQDRHHLQQVTDFYTLQSLVVELDPWGTGIERGVAGGYGREGRGRLGGIGLVTFDPERDAVLHGVERHRLSPQEGATCS